MISGAHVCFNNNALPMAFPTSLLFFFLLCSFGAHHGSGHWSSLFQWDFVVRYAFPATLLVVSAEVAETPNRWQTLSEQD